MSGKQPSHASTQRSPLRTEPPQAENVPRRTVPYVHTLAPPTHNQSERRPPNPPPPTHAALRGNLTPALKSPEGYWQYELGAYIQA